MSKGALNNLSVLLGPWILMLAVWWISYFNRNCSCFQSISKNQFFLLLSIFLFQNGQSLKLKVLQAYKTVIVSKQDAKRLCWLRDLEQNKAEKRTLLVLTAWPHLGQFCLLCSKLILPFIWHFCSIFMLLSIGSFRAIWFSAALFLPLQNLVVVGHN